MKKPWWWIIVRFELFFRWYDLWVGAFIDLERRVIYICPVPMFGVKVSWRPSDEPYP